MHFFRKIHVDFCVFKNFFIVYHNHDCAQRIEWMIFEIIQFVIIHRNKRFDCSIVKKHRWITLNDEMIKIKLFSIQKNDVIEFIKFSKICSRSKKTCMFILLTLFNHRNVLNRRFSWRIYTTTSSRTIHVIYKHSCCL